MLPNKKKQGEQKTISDQTSDDIDQTTTVSGKVFGDVFQIGKLVIQHFENSKNLKRGFLLLGLLFIVVSTILYMALRPKPPERMSGDFRIAVAGFAESGLPTGSNLGIELAEGVYLRLQQTVGELDTEFTVTIWDPGLTGSVRGADATERANAAANIAQRIGADMVVYGIVDAQDNPWRVKPEFYLSTENSYEADEIIGQHDLGDALPIASQGSIADRINVSTEFSIRTQALSHITVGLAYYAVQDFESALANFQLAERLEGWEHNQSRKVLFLLSGNAAGKSNNLELAYDYFQESLAIEPEYSRAYIGLASVYYMMALRPFEDSLEPEDTDLDLLNLAIENYNRALLATEQPPLADVTPKARFGLGQCYFMEVYAGSEASFDAAMAEFTAVIEAFDDGKNPRIRELAAESHARLGLIYSLVGDFSRAAEEYATAASLLTHELERQALYQSRADDLQSRSTTP